MAKITQLSPIAIPGKRYGSFAGKEQPTLQIASKLRRAPGTVIAAMRRNAGSSPSSNLIRRT